MRFWRQRAPKDIHATDAVPPTYASLEDFVGHALRNPANGWFESWRGVSVGTVDRCLQLNAQQIATMPLRYRHSAATQGSVYQWVTDPDPAWYPNGITDAIFALVWSMYAHGDAFLWVTSRYESGYPRTWTILDPVTMHVQDDDGVRAYRSNQVWLNPGDVVQITRNPNGALRGTSAVKAYWANVASAYEAELYAADVYQSTGVNRVALKSARRLTADQAAEVQAQWVQAVSKRLGAPAIIPPDLDFLQTLTISPKDLMLLESRDWDARQIAAAFGVPAILLNIAVSGGLTYQNPVQLFELWWRSELMPCAVKIAEALSRWLPRGNWVEFDPSQSIRPDLQTMVTTYSKLYADGAITIDEYRAAVLDLPPLERGDQATELYEEAGAHGSIGAPPHVEEVLMS
ncbi:MAG TPA: phage portal protein [Gaiellales bacterium]|jgi:HK97 family phage portal protein|nr:phage portal protein [Gaiellales bacterium]